MAKTLAKLCATYFQQFLVNNKAIFTNMKSFGFLSSD